MVSRVHGRIDGIPFQTLQFQVEVLWKAFASLLPSFSKNISFSVGNERDWNFGWIIWLCDLVLGIAPCPPRKVLSLISGLLFQSSLIVKDAVLGTQNWGKLMCWVLSLVVFSSSLTRRTIDFGCVLRPVVFLLLRSLRSSQCQVGIPPSFPHQFV